MADKISPYNSPIAYTIPNLPGGINLEVKKSANAWWVERQKVHELLAAFRIGCTIKEACSYAGITKRRYIYFSKEHSQIKEVKKGFKHMIAFHARATLVKAAMTDPKMAMKYLERKLPEEFGRPSNRKGDLNEQVKARMAERGSTKVTVEYKTERIDTAKRTETGS